MRPSPWVDEVPHRRLILAAPALLLAARRASAATAQGAEAAALIAALRAGGVVTVMRHGITDRSQVDTGDLANRAGQRNLSAEGRAQSLRTGRAVAALGIPLGQVLTSPVFRARDTAELAFGARAVVEPKLTADDYTPDAALLRDRIAWLGTRSGRPSAPGATDVLVGHIVPLGMMLGRGLAQAEFPEGSFAVFAPGRGLRGILAAETLWAAAAV
ncbi:histidine phosphatase family protein [Falsiroseomonas sp.]|uniref:histidine phosphatase family protein n=1 Tax=Falsiroseomonas sp. TaxID=2870721 RepID=UPI0034A5C8D3